jgi:hypothetical protein
MRITSAVVVLVLTTLIVEIIESVRAGTVYKVVATAAEGADCPSTL